MGIILIKGGKVDKNYDNKNIIKTKKYEQK